MGQHLTYAKIGNTEYGIPVVSVGRENGAIVPGTKRVLSVYPHPTRHFAMIAYVLVRAVGAQIEIYDLLGRRVGGALIKSRRIGIGSLHINVSRSSAGQYFLVLVTENGKYSEHALTVV